MGRRRERVEQHVRFSGCNVMIFRVSDKHCGPVDLIEMQTTLDLLDPNFIWLGDIP